ncbi:MAG TPA: sulfite exporter TauE/SafE family protein [Acidimicrobiia bacterium]|nr:sulfite exporter TauE/SafE family protein [Acidimicrobiia bacterium]
MTPSEPVFDLRLVGIGIAGGAISGFFGVGGGIVLVPLLLGYMGLTRRAAHATSLGAIILLSLAGMVGFALSGEVDPVVGVTIGVGGMVGAVIGAQLMNRLSARTLRLVFAVVLIGAGVRMVF